jgi:outer membrane protein assembly factor BamD (BamD/ComL family)
LRKINLNKFLVLIALFLASCSGSDERPEYRERSLAAIYNNAVYNLERGRVQQAAFEFDEVERQHPLFLLGKTINVNVSLCLLLTK